MALWFQVMKIALNVNSIRSVALSKYSFQLQQTRSTNGLETQEEPTESLYLFDVFENCSLQLGDRISFNGKLKVRDETAEVQSG